MPIVIPAEFLPVIDAAEHQCTPLDEPGFAGHLLASLPPYKKLNVDELRGVTAEREAWRFQRARFESQRVWDMYWSNSGGWTDEKGRTVYSPSVDEVDDEIIAHWISRSENSANPVFRARFADLAWEIGRFKKTHARITQELALRAIDGYLASNERLLAPSEMDAWLWLDRALELAVGIKHEPKFLATRAAVFTFFRAHPRRRDARSALFFDDLLWSRKLVAITTTERSEIIDVLEKELSLRSNIGDPNTFDPHAATDIAERLGRWRRAAGEAADRQRAIATAGAAFEHAAKNAGGLVAVGWLEELLVKYREANLLADVARVEGAIRERIADAAAEMKTTSVPIEIPQHQLDQWADAVAGSDSGEALRKIASELLISEGVTQQRVRDMLSGAPLMSGTRITLTGPGGITSATIGPLKTDLDGRTFHHAALMLSSWHPPFLNLAFDRTRARHALDAEAILRHVRGCAFFAEERMPLVRRGVEAWFAEDYVSAVHILVPQIEATLRDCMVTMRGSIWRRNRYDGFKAITLGEILTDEVFVAGYPSDVRFHLRALYTDPRGMNVRNHLSHGLMHPSAFQRGLGNLVVHSVLLVAMVIPTPSTPMPGSQFDDKRNESATTAEPPPT